MKIRLLRIILSTAIFALATILFELLKIDIFWLKLICYITAFTVAGLDIVIKALKNIFRGKVLDENFLMTLATVGAFAIGEFPEAVAVMLFYQVGELFQDYAVGKSRKSIAQLMDIRPDYANVLIDGKITKTDPENVKVGDIIVVGAGEKIPLDGVVQNGTSFVDTSAITGESVPQKAKEGSDVISGCINLNGVLEIKVEKEFAQSTVSKILDLVENASSKKSASERFITKFAKYYTPAVVVSAVLLATIPTIFGGEFLTWLYRAMIFLVVSCPCALVVSIPMSFFGGIGGASRAGVLVKGGNYLEILAKTDTVVFDKTGTLTKGVFKVQNIHAIDITDDELLEFTAYAEYYSNHPISTSLKSAYGKEIDKSQIQNVDEIAGFGISATVKNRAVLAGNIKLMIANNIDCEEIDVAQTVVYVAIDGKFAGYISIDDEIKEDSFKAIKMLKDAGIKRTIMLTGDKKTKAEAVANKLKIDKFYAQLLPNEKVAILEKILKSASGKVAFVGDGINDAPVLARADVGIAMGGLGSDASIEASDIVIMTDEPSKIATAKKIARKTLAIALQNTIFALSVKFAVLILSVFGIANMWIAIFADVGVAVLAILNALRTLSSKKI